MKEESPFLYIQKALHTQLSRSREISNFAPAMGKTTTQLAKELKTDYDRNKLGFADAIHLIALTDSINIVEMIAQAVDHTLMPSPKECKGSLDLLREVVVLSESVGKLCGESANALSDNSDLGQELSAREREKLTGLINQLLSQLVCLKWELKQ